MEGAGPTPGRAKRTLALLALCVLVTSLLQNWVGELTLYRGTDEARLRLHRAILTNQLPAGHTWYSIGGNGTNIRVLAVYLAEALHRLSGAPVLGVYRALDSFALCLVLLGLALYLGRWFEGAWCLVGLLYFSLAAVLSYHFYYFHPWDRLSQLMWLLLLALLREGRTVLLGLALAVATTIKGDVLLFPALYWLCAATRQNLWRAAGVTALLFGVSFGVDAALRLALPGGFDQGGFGSAAGSLLQLEKNWRHFWNLKRSYPPLLAFALPCAFAWLQLRRKPRFLVATALFALGMFAVHAGLSNFQEVRALLYLLILLLPSALWSLRALLEGDAPRGASGAPGSS